jgi:hypothetical protein
MSRLSISLHSSVGELFISYPEIDQALPRITQMARIEFSGGDRSERRGMYRKRLTIERAGPDDCGNIVSQTKPRLS